MFNNVYIFADSNGIIKSGRGESLLFFIFVLILFTLSYLLKIKHLPTRKLSGIEAIEEAIGRSTEMGSPILYVAGLKPVPAVSAIAGINVLGKIAEVAANYGTPIISPHNNSITMISAREEIKSGFLRAGNPELINSSKIFYITDSQFPYAASINSLTNEVKPGAIFYMGTFYAESLILTEHGQSTGAIQIAGTDSVAQIPFFITSCDYLLMGEELFTASAYIKKDLNSLKGVLMQDIAKIGIILYIIIRLLSKNL